MPIVVSSSALADNAIYVELDPVTDEDSLAAVYRDVETREKAAQKVIEIARDVYADGIDLALRCAARAAESFSDFSDQIQPNEIELQLAIKLDSEIGAVLVKAGAEAQLQVSFRWSPKGRS